MSETGVMTIGIKGLVNAKLPEGLYIIGEFRGVEHKPHNGRDYYKLKVLNGDYMRKYDIKPEQYGEIKNAPAAGKMIAVRYYEFPTKFDRNMMNSVCNEFAFLN